MVDANFFDARFRAGAGIDVLEPWARKKLKQRAMEPSQRFEKLQASLFEALVSTTKAANGLPPTDLEFHKSMDDEFASNLSSACERLTSLTNTVLGYAGAVDLFQGAEDVSERYEDVVVDLVDNLLEKADYCIDEASGAKSKAPAAPQQTAPVIAQITSTKRSNLAYNLVHAQNIARPQLQFKDPPDNSANTPWIRKIKEKPNAKVPLTYGTPRHTPPRGMSPAMEIHVKSLGIGDALSSLPHPYEYEINHLEYPEHLFESRPPIDPLPFDGSKDDAGFQWIASVDDLDKMIAKLEVCNEIAVDLEHHNYRSFQGFVCLMQISSRTEDYIIDTLELREHLHRLGNVFSDPSVLKVFHGAESDIVWLQRDFGLYIVNLFDTYHATKVLEMPGHGLAYLLQTYCKFEADKKYQLADWRIRPLPAEMLKYARSDTHFLLFVYDLLRNELLNRSDQVTHNLMQTVLQRSAETALRRYEKEGYDGETGEGPNGWRNLYSKWSRPLSPQQFAVFKAIHAWRDQVAREEDESVRYVLPNHMLFSLAERMPTEGADVIGACNPAPPLVRMNAPDLALAIKEAKIAAVTDAVAIPVVQEPATVSPVIEVHMLDAPLPPRELPKTSLTVLQQMVAVKSAFFGPALVTPPQSPIDNEAASLAARIHATLSLSVPQPDDILPDQPTVEEHIYVPPQPAVANADAKRDRTEIITVGKTKKKRAHAQVEEPVEASPAKYPKKQPSPKVKDDVKKNTEVIEIDNDTEDEEVLKQVSAPSSTPSSVNGNSIKKKKNRKKKRKSNVDDTAQIKPFDYSSVHAAAVVQPTPGGKKKKDKKEPKVKGGFNPYSNLEISEEHKRRDPRISSHQKGGNKSMTFKRPP